MMRLSVIVPFHRDEEKLRRCLAAIEAAARQLPSDVSLRETIVVADGAAHDITELAAEHGATAIAISGPRGPAVARNRGAAAASGDVLVFIDSDVVIDPSALARLSSRLVSEPQVSAIFGAYDDHPDARGFISQGKNLAHSFIHHRSAGEAQTFWAGLGAVRAEPFAVVGGFDESFHRPSVEDIELGYRLRAANRRIVLDPTIQGRHLKRWTLRSAVVTEIRDRGIPWTQLLHRYEGVRDSLNVTHRYRACVVIAYLSIGCLAGAIWWRALLIPAIAGFVALWMLDRSYYRFFTERRGAGFAIAWFPVHVLHHLCNGISFAIGTLLYLVRRT